jgi:hypothetical protein
MMGRGRTGRRIGKVATALVFATAGCSNFSTLQTARALPTGTHRVHLGGGALLTSELSPVATSSSASTSSLRFPYTEIGARFGLARHVDLGAKFTIPGSLGTDLKFQFVDGSVLAAAAGFQVAYASLKTSGQTTHLVDLALPVYVSVDITDWFGLYGGAKYLQRIGVGGSSSSTPFYSAGGGIRVGNFAGVMVELMYVRQGSSTFEGAQLSTAFFIGSAPSAGFALGRDGKLNRWRPKADAWQEDPKQRRPSVVIETLERGRFFRISHDDLRSWKEGEYACAVDEKGKEAACGNVIRSDADSATVRLSKPVAPIEQGMEVILRP